MLVLHKMLLINHNTGVPAVGPSFGLAAWELANVIESESILQIFRPNDFVKLSHKIKTNATYRCKDQSALHFRLSALTRFKMFGGEGGRSKQVTCYPILLGDMVGEPSRNLVPSSICLDLQE